MGSGECTGTRRSKRFEAEGFEAGMACLRHRENTSAGAKNLRKIGL
jgi:hypothetical protein